MSLSLFPFLNEALASSGRDYDSNAIMYGGALTYAELINKYDHGTGKQFQSSTELQNFYKTLGMGKEFFPKLVEGKVYKDGHVTVGNKTVATNVYSAGRHDMPGSTRDSRFPYPVFWRHPSVSFRSNALDAFVYVNDDNTMAFAIIKSCGNAVKGVGVKQKHKITVEKFEDKNGNKIKDSEEGMLSGWSFKVTGNGIDKTVMTGVNGTVEVKDLPNGTYTITEVLQTGWTNTTGLTKTVTIKDADQTVCFGNKKVPEKKFRIKVIKFEDCNKTGILR
jgi:hypothetical protein